MKFLGFSKSGDEISLQIIFSNFFFFFEKNYFQEFLLQILENPKNFMISFFVSTGFELKSFPPGKDSKMNLSLLEKDQANSEELF